MDIVAQGGAKIKLTRGFVAIVDEDDYERVSKYKWWVVEKPRTKYAMGYVEGDQVLLHRFIADAPPGTMMDHINRDGLDNRKSNLRFVTRSQNGANCEKRRSVGVTSTYKGVYYNRDNKRWVGRVKVNGESIRRYFATEIEAAHARDEMAKEHFGEYALLNFDN